MNFLYNDIVHASTNYNRLVHKFPTDRRGYVLEHGFTKFSEQQLRLSRSFKGTDFGSNRKLIYDSYPISYPILSYLLSCVKFYLDVNRWLAYSAYQMAKKHCGKFQSPDRVGCTNVTDDKRQTDDKRTGDDIKIGNVNVSSRSLQTGLCLCVSVSVY